jgi:error-prone DNA polymerase
MLRAVGGLDEAFMVPAGRGDEAKSGGGHDPREVPLSKIPGNYLPDHQESIAVKARNFR